MIFNDPERIAALTPQNPFDRLDDGRPNVPDDLLNRLKLVTNDEAWGTLERGHNYHYLFEGDWMHLHDDVVLVGRAVTCQFVPVRPDLNDVVQGIGAKEGRDGGQNTWVIDTLRPISDLPLSSHLIELSERVAAADEDVHPHELQAIKLLRLLTQVLPRARPVGPAAVGAAVKA